MPDIDPVFNPLGALQQMSDMPRMMMRQQEEAYGRNVEQLGRVREAADAATAAGPQDSLAAMALAAGRSSPMVGGMGALLANIGGAYSASLANQAQQRFEREKGIGILTERVSPFGGSGVATQLAHAILNPIQNVGGVGVSRLSGETVVPKEFTTKYLDLRDKIYQRLAESGIPNAFEEADRMAKQAIYAGLRDPSVAGSTYAQRPEQTPMPSQGGARPTSVSLAPKGAVVEGEQPGTVETVGVDQDRWVRKLQKDEQQAVAQGDYGRAAEVRQARMALQQNTVPQPASKAELGRQETAAKETAKDLVDYEKGLFEKSDAANTMLRNLGYIREQAKNANFGAGAEFKTQALKWADTLGVSLTDDDKKAMNANQIIGKVALQLATIGAKNISSRPTQLEFEKLLTQGVPAAGMTKDAFMKVLGMFEDTAKAEQGQLSEFMKFKHSMPAGSVSAGDFSDYWALRKDPRYYNISIQDILDTMKERKMTFNQVISKLRERK